MILWPGLDVLLGDEMVPKYRFSAFLPGASDLPARLRARGFDTVLITGTVTNVCCESSARDAMMTNFRVVMVSDGNAAMTPGRARCLAGVALPAFHRPDGHRHGPRRAAARPEPGGMTGPNMEKAMPKLPDDETLAREFDVLAARAGLVVPDDRRAGLFNEFKEIRRMAALVRQPRTAAHEPANIFSITTVTRSLRP